MLWALELNSIDMDEIARLDFGLDSRSRRGSPREWRRKAPLPDDTPVDRVHNSKAPTDCRHIHESRIPTKQTPTLDRAHRRRGERRQRSDRKQAAVRGK